MKIRLSMLCVASLLLAAGPSHAVLVHQYTFEDGTANDSVGSANGTLMSGATVSDGRVALDGLDDFVELDASTIAINTFPAITLELWHAQPVEDQGFSMTAAFGSTLPNTLGDDYLMISTTRGNQVSRAAIQNTVDEAAPFLDEVGVDGPELNDGLVHHYAATVSATDITYYIDGESQGATPLGDTLISELSNDFAYLGKGLYENDGTVQGSIHEFSIWDEALDATTIGQRFQAGPVGGAGVGPALMVDRDTGAVELTNDLGSRDLVRYTVASAAGALDTANWDSITETGDANSGGSIDADDDWEIVTETANDITEQDPIGGGGPDDGAPLAASLPLGDGLWTQSPIEDLTAEIVTFDGFSEETLSIPVFFTGNEGAPFSLGDFNTDGDVNEADYTILLANNQQPLAGATPLETFPFGDVNGDLVNNFFDFRLFQIEFDAENGPGAFSAMAAAYSATPEPTTACLALGVLGGALLMRRRQFLSARFVAAILFAALAMGGWNPASAQTTDAYWRFEAGPVDTPVLHTAEFGEFSADVLDDTGNGNDLSIFSEAGCCGFGYRNDLPNASLRSGAANNFSIQNTGGFPGSFTGPGTLQTMTPSAFTIEASFKPETGGFRTIVGRDGMGTSTANAALAALYLQIQPDDSVAITFGDVDGVFHEAVSAPGLINGFPFPNTEQGQWYHMAGVSDGERLSLYLADDAAGNGYKLVAQTDLTLSGSADTALTNGGPDPNPEDDWTAGDWTVGRGLFNGQHTDRAYGFIDEVRISDEALELDEFLYDIPADALSLVVNTLDGSVSIRNNTTSALSFDSYQIESRTDNALLTGDADWNSLSDQNLDQVDDGADPGETWDESPGVGSSLLAEVFLQGETTLAPQGSISLGDAYDFTVAGSGNPGDLEFLYSAKGEAFLTPAQVIFMGDGLPGDFNNDGLVDAIDYALWRENLGSGDDSVLNGNGDGTPGVGTGDFNLWKQNFGAAAAAANSAGAPVPEPATTALLLLSTAMTLVANRRRPGR